MPQVSSKRFEEFMATIPVPLSDVIADDKLPEFADENLPVFVQE